MKYIVVDAGSETPVYLQIMQQVRDRVKDGYLSPGAPLPSVRQLAADLDINPNTVGKAYMLLEREGILHTVRRRGTFIADSARANLVKALDERVEEAVERVLVETSRFGVEKRHVLEALRRRLADEGTHDNHNGGESK